MHLTNYSINKKNIDFQQNIDEIAIWKQIEDIIIKTIISAEP